MKAINVDMKAYPDVIEPDPANASKAEAAGGGKFHSEMHGRFP
jgi:hypothetical protein